MLLTKFVRYQLGAFAIITVVVVSWILVSYLRVPAMLGIGRSTVELALPSGAGLYPKSNVTYRGVHAGVVHSLRIDADTVVVTMHLDAGLDIPKTDLRAEVHSRSAIGEQYIELLPQTDSAPYLADGDRIDSTRLPTPTAHMVDALDAAMGDIPREDLQTVITESGVAFRNSGPDLQQILDGLNNVLDEGHRNLAPTLHLIDNAGALLDTQVAAGDDIRAWTGYLGSITGSLAANDTHVGALLAGGQEAGTQAADLFGRITPTLPRALGNLHSVAEVLRIYNMSLEQILVVYPPLAAMAQSIVKGSEPGMANLDFNLNVNAPPPCLTGFVPPDQRRSPSESAVIDSPTPNYCGVAPGEPYVPRGARNMPCMENPGVRAPDVDSCRAGGTAPLGTNPWIGGP